MILNAAGEPLEVCEDHRGFWRSYQGQWSLVWAATAVAPVILLIGIAIGEWIAK